MGGVIVDIDDNAALQYLTQNGIQAPSELLHRLHPACLQYETGQMNTEAFIAALHKTHGSPELTKAHIQKTWESIIIDVPNTQFSLLTTLQSHIPLYALSNTNSLHWQHINTLCQQRHGHTLTSRFTKAYLSYETGLLKPSPDSYTLLLQETGLTPQTCLLIDDRAENIDAACALGFQTLHATTLITLEQLSSVDKTLANTIYGRNL